MVNESEELGYTDVPPQGAQGRTNPPQEKRGQFERPVYGVRADEAAGRPTTGGKMSYTVLTVAGLLVLAIFGAYFYQTGTFGSKRPDVLQAPPAMAVTGDKSAVRIELVRTIDLLNQIEAKLADNPNELAKIRRLRDDAKSLIESMGE